MGVGIEDAVKWLAEVHGNVQVLAESADGTALIEVAGRRVCLVPNAHGQVEFLDVGQGRRGRPNLVEQDRLQRQFVACFDQLSVLRGGLADQGSTKWAHGSDPERLRAALLQAEGAIHDQGRFWLGTLRLAVLEGDSFLPVGIDSGQLVVERRPEAKDALSADLATESGLVLCEDKPVERWPALMRGKFSPENLALRILSVFYRMRFNFLDDKFEDHNLFIRKAVYPLAPRWKAAKAQLEEERNRRD